MKDGRPWTYQVDTFGVASTAHCLLWGSYMNITKSNDEWKISGSSLKR